MSQDTTTSIGVPGPSSPPRAHPAAMAEPSLRRTRGKRRAGSPTVIDEGRTKRSRMDSGRRDRKARAVRALADIEWLRDCKGDVLAATTEVKQGYERLKATIVDLAKKRARRTALAAKMPTISEEARRFANATPEQRDVMFRAKYGAKKPWREHTAEELEALYRAHAGLPKRPQDYTFEELAELYRSQLDACPVHCTCRRTALQQSWFDNSSILRPRPRMGVDAQGIAFQDWSACPPQTSQQRAILPEKEMLLDRQLAAVW
ncbi:hypothetical protein PUNSTDRAFT_146485, partial [Punctularia strigosozonata HHB-11173 SS5]